MDGQMYIGNRKKNPIDDEITNNKSNKNHKKNLNKSRAAQKVIQTMQSKKNEELTQKKDAVSPKPKKVDPKIQKKVDDIKAILQHHKEQTILKMLEKHNYNQQEALEELFNISPDDEEDAKQVIHEEEEFSMKKRNKRQRENNKKVNNTKEIGNQILNELYDNHQDIDPTQFEELFQEITDIIKAEEKSQGMPIFQINQFIDQCYLTKNFILENQTQIYIDENDQLTKQTQIFLEQIIKSKVVEQLKRRSDFPTLGSLDNNKNQPKGQIQKIQQSYKQQSKKLQFFTPNKLPQMHGDQNYSYESSVYSINQNPGSYRDIMQLSKQYSRMPIDKLKFIYIRFQDIKICKNFLDRHYPEMKTAAKTEEKKVFKEPVSKKVEIKPTYKRLEDENFKNYSLNQIREELDHLFKRRSVFQMTKGKTTNIAYKKQLNRIAHLDDPRIRKLTEVARFKILQEMSNSHPQYIDLHGYREEQIDDLFDEIEDMVTMLFKQGSSRIDTVKVGLNVYCIVQAMTGKGIHSRYSRSVLKPAIISWCERSGNQHKQSQDRINVYIKLR